MAASYIKLDFDWYADPKVLAFADDFGKAALVDLVKLFCAMGEFYGRIDLKEQAQRLHIEQVLGKRRKALATFLDRCALHGLIRRDMYEGFQVVCSDRSVRDGEARIKRREYAREASEAAKEKRDRERAGEG